MGVDPAAAQAPATDRPYPRDLLLHELVLRHADTAPDRVAVAHGTDQLTYRGLVDRAGRWAAALRALGVGADDRVGVHLPRGPELVAALLGVLRAGAAYVPLDPGYPPERLAFMLADSAVTALVSTDPELAAAARPRVPVLAAPAAAPPPSRPGRPVTHPDALAYALYTSGSTGRPKGIGITHANVVDLLHWAGEEFGDDLAGVLAAASVSFDMSVLELFGALSRGGTAVLVDSPLDTTRGAADPRVRLVQAVPSVLAEVLRGGGLPGTVRTVVSGGEILPAALVAGLRAGGAVRIFNTYGPAETTSKATVVLLPDDDGGPDAPPPPIGRPVANHRCHVLGPAGRPAAADEPGELTIAGRGVARGYLGRPALTAERFVPEPYSGRPGERAYRSGDLARRNRAGVLHFVSRLDDQVKVRGVRIEPAEVEHALVAHRDVHAAAVVARGRPEQRSLVAYVVPVAAPLEVAPLLEHLRRVLPPGLVPDVVVPVDRLPRTPNGKLDRKSLGDPAASGRPGTGTPTDPAAGTGNGHPTPAPAAASPAPLDPTTGAAGSADAVEAGLATTVLRAWREALGGVELDPTADVYTCGGHSLAALRVAATLGRALGGQVPVRMLFERPTVQSLARGLRMWLEVDRPDAAADGPWPPPAEDPGVPSPTQLAVLDRADRDPGGPGLAAPLAVRLRGPLRVEALSAAAAAVARRHPVLRAQVAAGPRIEPAPTRTAPGLSLPDRLPMIDLARLGSGAGPAAETATAAFLHRSMPPRQQPLARCVLLRLAPDDHVLVLTVHRLAGDAWSVELISHELMAGYGAAVRGRAGDPADPVPRHPVQYADWGAEQHRRLGSARGAADLAYWSDALAGARPLVLHCDTGAPARPARPHRQYLRLPAELAAGVARLARTERTTPYVVLLAAYLVVLHRWSGGSDLVVGSPTAGRSHPELLGVVGPCADAFPVRCQVHPEHAFGQLVRAARDRMLEAYDHHVPFGLLAAAHQGGATRHPVYQASIVLQQPPSLLDPAHRASLYARHDIGDIEVSRFASGDGPMALDVEMMMFQRDDEIEAVLDTHPDAVPPDRAPELAADFLAAVEAGVAGPDRAVGDLLPAGIPS